MYGGTVGDQTLLTRVVREPDGTVGFQNLEPTPDGRLINAIAFRAQDGFLYGWQNQPTTGLVRIEDAGAGNVIFGPAQTVTGIPPTFGAFVGTFLADGRYFVWGTPSNPVGYIVDLSGPVPAAVGPITPDWDAGDPATGGRPLGDFAVSPVDGNLYAMVDRQIRQLILDGTTLRLGPVVGPTAGATTAGASAGVQYFSPAGAEGTFVYSGSHADGTVHIYTTDLATDAIRDLGSVGESVPAGDGASCANTLAVTKDANPRTVTAGGELTYTYTITARGLVDNPVNFVDTLPAGMTYVPGGVTVNGTFGPTNAYGGTDTLSISGVIPRNTTVTITARVRVSPDHACDADVDNQAQATMTPQGLPPVTIQSDDPATSSLDDPTRVRVVCAADLEIVKTASTSPLVPGQEATFTFVAKNNGPSTARNASVSDRLPSEFSFVSASQGCSEAGGTLTCTIGAMAPGASQTFTVTGRVASSLNRCLENTATVTSATPDPNTANNSSTVCPPPRGRSDLSITKDPSRTQLPAGGGQVMYTLVVRNHGPSDNPRVEVSDPLAAGLTLASAQPSQGTCTTTNNTVSCDLGSLRSGGSAQVLVTVNVTGTPGCITNTARVRGAREDPTPDNNQDSAQVCVPVLPPPPPPPFDLVVTKTANDRSLFIGQRVTYRVVVRNNGPGAAPDVRLTDTLNAPVTVVSARSTAGSCERRIPMACELGTIAAGQSVTITIVAKHRESGCRQRNAASATGNGTDTNPANNLDVVDVCVRKVRLQLSKVASREVVRGGETFTYRIRVRNPTKGEARNSRLCDRLPSGLRYVSSQPRAQVSGRQQCWTISLLKAGEIRTFRVRVRAAPGASGRKTNTATLTGPDTRRLRANDTVRLNPLPDRPTG
jgi:uncharacterized repeat protein (TIGR01451 family)